MKILKIVGLIVIIFIVIITVMPVDWYPKINGYIYNPVLFKKYPAMVPFKTGMSIYPGQMAIMGTPTSIIKKEDGSTEVVWK